MSWLVVCKGHNFCHKGNNKGEIHSPISFSLSFQFHKTGSIARNPSPFTCSCPFSWRYISSAAKTFQKIKRIPTSDKGQTEWNLLTSLSLLIILQFLFHLGSKKDPRKTFSGRSRSLGPKKGADWRNYELLQCIDLDPIRLLGKSIRTTGILLIILTIKFRVFFPLYLWCFVLES